MLLSFKYVARQARVAQWLEHHIDIVRVEGSIPSTRTTDMSQTFMITAAEAGQRLDVWCVGKLPDRSRTAIQKAIVAGAITINKNTVKPRQVIKENDEITIEMAATAEAAPAVLTPVDIPIIFEDKDVVVINKPAGISVHAGHGAREFTVVDWAKAHFPEISQVGDPAEAAAGIERPGIVHRLDKETSGVLIIAKTQRAYEHLKKQFKYRRGSKEYLALVFGAMGEPNGRIVRALARSKRNPLRRTIDPEGKEAITEWQKEEVLRGRFTLVRVYPQTGRMHQIRVHMHFLGFPIVGDKLYTFRRQKPPEGVNRHLLHAESLTLTMLDDQQRTFTAPIPEDFANVLNNLRHGVSKPVAEASPE